MFNSKTLQALTPTRNFQGLLFDSTYMYLNDDASSLGGGGKYMFCFQKDYISFSYHNMFLILIMLLTPILIKTLKDRYWNLHITMMLPAEKQIRRRFQRL